MGINQVPIDFEPYNLFPGSRCLSAVVAENIQDATAVISRLRCAGTKGRSTFDFEQEQGSSRRTILGNRRIDSRS